MMHLKLFCIASSVFNSCTAGQSRVSRVLFSSIHLFQNLHQNASNLHAKEIHRRALIKSRPYCYNKLLTQFRYFSRSEVLYKSKKSKGKGQKSGNLTHMNEDFKTGEYDSDNEEEGEFGVKTIIPGEAYNVLIIQPNVKQKAIDKVSRREVHLKLAESIALINTLQWHVVDSQILNAESLKKKQIFGSGNYGELTKRIRSDARITAVFINVDRLSGIQLQEMKDAWGVEVVDRFTIVLEIFKQHASTMEAKLQIALAEIPYLRTRIRYKDANFDQQSGSQQYISGSGETFLEKQLRVLQEREVKIKKRLLKIKRRRELWRVRKQFPVVAVVGYTNAGKTSLIRALTGDLSLEPQDQLFATLDVTAHKGFLTNGMPVLYMDTVGFISDLPHSLVASFEATLEDVLVSDVIIHVRDVSHPDTISQRSKVIEVLEEMKVPTSLMGSMIEICNKADLLSGSEETVDGIPISAVTGLGLDQLKESIQQSVMLATGTVSCTLCVPLNGEELGWLYMNATVNDVRDSDEEADHLHVDVIMSDVVNKKFHAKFGNLIHKASPD